ncbi:NADPH-dependent FMN reductase [Planomonospora corallina]|uniref:NADPH-dependent FMN reductase n=1 Tax=Planomonospora corallina TaxID=1806052 RepID=A0ABV8IFI3_9ACTN
MKIVGIAGSLRPAAHVGRLLEAAARELPASAEFTAWTGLGEIPACTGGPLPPPAAGLCALLAGADGLLVTAPEHSVLPVQLLHALAWASSPAADAVLLGKPVAVVTACVRPHEAMWTQTELRRLLDVTGAVVRGADLPASPAAPWFDDTGRLADPEMRDRLRRAVTALCAARSPEPVLDVVAGRIPEKIPGRTADQVAGRISGGAADAVAGKAPLVLPAVLAGEVPVGGDAGKVTAGIPV